MVNTMTSSSSKSRALGGAVVIAVLTTAISTRAVAQCPPATPAGLYADARRAFEAQRFDECVSLLRRAYGCDPNPVYRGNIARAYEEANRPNEALQAWHDYLNVTTDARERRVVEGRISVLTKLLADLDRLEHEKRTAEEGKRAADEKAQNARVGPTENEELTRARPPAAAWVFTVAGGAGLASGAVMGLLALSKHSAATQAGSVDRAEAMQEDAQALARAANWSFAIGSALGAVGASWIGIILFGAPKGPSARRSSAAVTVRF
jgi:tetratricopeptide (TPR) repeat protein